MTNVNAVIAKREGVVYLGPVLSEMYDDYTIPENLGRLIAVLRGMDEADDLVLDKRLSRLHYESKTHRGYGRWLLFEMTQAQLADAVAKVLEESFQWQCPRCGAMLQSSDEHCPCEQEGGEDE